MVFLGLLRRILFLLINILVICPVRADNQIFFCKALKIETHHKTPGSMRYLEDLDGDSWEEAHVPSEALALADIDKSLFQ